MEMESCDPAPPLPAYTFVPGGPWPHPHRAPACAQDTAAVRGGLSSMEKSQWSAWFLRGIALFNAGYYWEAHEFWEDLWHVEGRKGPTADVLRALIKFAAAGVKVREGRPGGVPHALPPRRRLVRLGGRAGGGPPAWAGSGVPGRARSCIRGKSPRRPGDSGRTGHAGF